VKDASNWAKYKEKQAQLKEEKIRLREKEEKLEKIMFRCLVACNANPKLTAGLDIPLDEKAIQTIMKRYKDEAIKISARIAEIKNQLEMLKLKTPPSEGKSLQPIQAEYLTVHANSDTASVKAAPAEVQCEESPKVENIAHFIATQEGILLQQRKVRKQREKQWSAIVNQGRRN
jgi:hypothetical protein